MSNGTTYAYQQVGLVDITPDSLIAEAREQDPHAPLVALIDRKIALEQNNTRIFQGREAGATRDDAKRVVHIHQCLVRAIAQLVEERG